MHWLPIEHLYLICINFDLLQVAAVSRLAKLPAFKSLLSFIQSNKKVGCVSVQCEKASSPCSSYFLSRCQVFVFSFQFLLFNAYEFKKFTARNRIFELVKSFEKCCLKQLKSPNRCLERLVTNLALMTQPVFPTRQDRVCFFLRTLLKSEKKCLIAKAFYSFPSYFHFQTFFSAVTFETSELVATSYPL